MTGGRARGRKGNGRDGDGDGRGPKGEQVDGESRGHELVVVEKEQVPGGVSTGLREQG